MKQKHLQTFKLACMMPDKSPVDFERKEEMIRLIPMTKALGQFKKVKGQHKRQHKDAPNLRLHNICGWTWDGELE